MVLWFNNDDKSNPEEPPSTCVLLEIVSARDLSHKKSLLDHEVDPYCIVRLNGEEVHKTRTISNDPDPIWTVLTGSLCLLKIPTQDETKDDETKEETKDDDPKQDVVSEEKSVVVEVCHGNQCLGIVTVPFSQVLESQGDRQEYPVCISPGEEGDVGTLALRFRIATPDDLAFFGKARPELKNGASDINLKSIREKTLFQSYSRRDTDKTMRFRVQPYPDPDRVQQTEWLSREELSAEAFKPSKKWAEAGDGDVGRVYVEIIGCKDLPNMDVGVNDLTDPFVGIVFEDTMVRTNVIHDSNNPRWMPWCTRAFCFNVKHPTSLLMLGVFDYDSTPIKDHDPVGRVVINMANFQSHTSYLLHYALHDDPQQEDDRGTIIVRLRVEWKSEAEARRLAFTLPPRFLINVDNQRAYHVLKYICRGKLNMEQASMESVKFYANELMSYGQVYCYLIDVMIGVLLWRGRARVGSFSIWFPIHSVALLTAAVVAMEVPTLAPAVFFFGIAYMMLTINYYGSNYPYPWNRCKSWHETNMVLALGRSVHPPIYIEPNTGVEEAMALENLDKVKGERVARFLWDAKTVGLKVRRVYKKSNVTNISIDTEEKEAWFAGNLYYVHMLLYYLCTYLRLWRTFVNWRGYFAHKLTLTCLGLGFAWVFLPMHQVLLWVSRLFVWTLFGPWMKLVDIYYAHPCYRTKEELLADPTVKDTHLESVLTSNSLRELGKSARLASEEALKLKDMREQQFGKLSQLVPLVDMSRHPYIPLPDSTAQPYGENGFVDTPLENQRWERVQGQQLKGVMIPKS